MNSSTPSRWMYTLILLAALSPVANGGVLPVIPDDPRFDHLTVDDGLPNNTIWDIVRGESGFLWLGTLNGLVRFNGYDLAVFRPVPGDTTAISGRDVIVLRQDPEGKLWIGSRDGGLDYLDPRTGRFGRPTPAATAGTPRTLPTVIDIDVAPDSTVWVASPDAGLWRHDRTRNLLERMPPPDPTISSVSLDSLTALLAADDGTVWVGSRTQGLSRFDPGTRSWRHSALPDQAFDPGRDQVEDIFQDSRGRIWIATRSGLYGWRPDHDEIHAYPDHADGGDRPSSMLDIAEDIDGAIWISTLAGLLRFDPESGEFRSFSHDPGRGETLASGPQLCVHCDQSGSVWLGGWQVGLSVLDPWRNNFTLLTHSPTDPGSLDRNTVVCILEDISGTLWVGTGNQNGRDRGGLNRRRPGSDRFERVEFPGNGEPWSVQSLVEATDGTIWVGTVQGLWILPPDDRQPRRPQVGEPLASQIADIPVYAITTDLDGHIWLGTLGNGAYHINRRTGDVTVFQHDPHDDDSLSGNQVIELHRDARGRIWAGTATTGLNLYLPKTKTFRRFRDSARGLNTVTGLVDGSHDRLYVATSAGLFLVSPDGGIDPVMDKTEEMFSETIASLQGDDDGGLWAFSSRGLVHLDPAGKARLYDRCSGVPSGTLHLESHLGRDGTLYFGSQHGLVVVHPLQIRNNPFDMPSIITGLYVAGRPWPLEDKTQDATVFPFVERVALPYNLNDLEFTFASLCLIRPEHNQYRYRLDGADRDWHVAGSRNHANYTNLDPGSYTLRVQSRRDAGSWSPITATLDVEIRPQWWREAWAKFLYVVVGIFLTLLTYRQIVNRERMRLALELERAEARQLQQLDRFKSRFFANISHEFQTPLTLINVPLNRMIERASGDDRSALQRMRRNANRLGRLIEQLLALSRLEAGRLPVIWEHRDATGFTRGLAANFSTLARDRNIHFETGVPDDPFFAWFDPDMLDKILVNLLSNAFKFTPDGGRIRVVMEIESDVSECPVPTAAETDGATRTADACTVRFSVTNSGTYIPPDMRERIFDRYRQLSASDSATGSGIGLALVHELVQLMAGSIAVTSDRDAGTSFVVTLPLFLVSPLLVVEPEVDDKFDAGSDPVADLTVDDDDDAAAGPPERPRLLIVEDYDDMRAFIREELSGEYDCSIATDGNAGLARALDEIPDLVVSDVMMPGIDGFELCRRLKEDERTSHIPVILLTARTEAASRLEGLTIGADDYLTKPFDPEELRVRAANLIDQRRRLQKRYARRLVLLDPSAMPVSSADERFLLRARKIVEEHLGETDFSVEKFSHELGVSRPHLLRKIKALTGMTPQAFIRTHRLQRAAQFLENGYGNVTEVAYAVGLQSLSTFAKRFKEQYGVLPSEYPLRPGSDGDDD